MVDDKIIAKTFTKTVKEAQRERVVAVYLTHIGRFADNQDITFTDALLDLHATRRDRPAITHVLERVDLPDDRTFLGPWAALIAYYTTYPLWPFPRDLSDHVDRCYDELCADGHITRRS